MFVIQLNGIPFKPREMPFYFVFFEGNTDTQVIWSRWCQSFVLEMDEAPDSLIADNFNWFYISFSSNSPGISRCFEGVLTVLEENHGEEKKRQEDWGECEKTGHSSPSNYRMTILEYHSEFSPVSTLDRNFCVFCTVDSLQVLVWDGCKCNWSAFLDFQRCLGFEIYTVMNSTSLFHRKHKGKDPY